jgi:hypothetical protein
LELVGKQVDGIDVILKVNIEDDKLRFSALHYFAKVLSKVK